MSIVEARAGSSVEELSPTDAVSGLDLSLHFLVVGRSLVLAARNCVTLQKERDAAGLGDWQEIDDFVAFVADLGPWHAPQEARHAPPVKEFNNRQLYDIVAGLEAEFLWRFSKEAVDVRKQLPAEVGAWRVLLALLGGHDFVTGLVRF